MRLIARNIVRLLNCSPELQTTHWQHIHNTPVDTLNTYATLSRRRGGRNTALGHVFDEKRTEILILVWTYKKRAMYSG